jgi:hypothetical protein
LFDKVAKQECFAPAEISKTISFSSYFINVGSSIYEISIPLKFML